jgi:hypothetical protein
MKAIVHTQYGPPGVLQFKKLGTVGEKIVTVWGVGYRFVV